MIDEKNVSLTKTKHLGWLIFLFVGIGGVAIGATVLYAMGLFTHFTGYKDLDITADESVNYRDGVYCNLYFDTNEMAANQHASKASPIFSDALKDAYKRTDPQSRYDGIISLSYVNDAVGEDV